MVRDVPSKSYSYGDWDGKNEYSGVLFIVVVVVVVVVVEVEVVVGGMDGGRWDTIYFRERERDLVVRYYR